MHTATDTETPYQEGISDMRYELRLTAYDALDQVWVSCTVDGTPDTPGLPIERVLVRSTRAQGTGTAVATEWTREALVAMLRAL
jgi:hypothetical protein